MNNRVKLARLFIDEMGGRKRIAKELKITIQAVSMWKTAGMPKTAILLFKDRYPDLNVWKDDSYKQFIQEQA